MAAQGREVEEALQLGRQMTQTTIPRPTPSSSTPRALCSPAARLPAPSLPAGTLSPGSAGHLSHIFEAVFWISKYTCEVGDAEEVRTMLCLNPKAGGRGKGGQGGDEGVRQGEDGQVGQAGKAGRQVGEGVVVEVEFTQESAVCKASGKVGETVVGKVEAFQAGLQPVQGVGQVVQAIASEGEEVEG